MKNSRMVKMLLVAALLPGCVLLRCINPNSGGTEIGDAKVAGVLYNSGGSRSAGTKVACIPRHYNPNGGSRTGIDSTVTDDTGGYRFKTMPADTYNIFAQSDSGLVYIESVVVTPVSPTHIPPDTLEAAGSIRGRIELEPGDDARNVFIIFLGTYVFRMADDSVGNFAISNLAEGRYRVRILANLPNYRVMDTAFTITAGRDSVLPQPIRLQYTGIPIPQGLRIEYDIMKQIVTLIWNKPTNGRAVQGYNIYRKHQDSSLVILKSDWPDTVYQDSSGNQDITYEYRVAAVDTNTTEGVKSAAGNVTVVSAFIISDTLFSITAGFPFSVQVDKNGTYVIVNGVGRDLLDTKPAKVERYNSQGISINSWDVDSGIVGCCILDKQIAISDTGTIFVWNKNNTILEYDTTGTLQSQFQFPGTIHSFVLYKDTLFISDNVAHTISAYTTKGVYLFSWGGDGLGNGQFKTIVSLACDSIGRVYVNDALNENRLQVFQKTGAFIYAIDLGLFGIVGGKLNIVKDLVFIITTYKLYVFETTGVYSFVCQAARSVNAVVKADANEINVITGLGAAIKILYK